jgi:hypothetical protein
LLQIWQYGLRTAYHTQATHCPTTPHPTVCPIGILRQTSRATVDGVQTFSRGCRIHSSRTSRRTTQHCPISLAVWLPSARN